MLTVFVSFVGVAIASVLLGSYFNSLRIGIATWLIVGLLIGWLAEVHQAIRALSPSTTTGREG